MAVESDSTAGTASCGCRSSNADTAGRARADVSSYGTQNARPASAQVRPVAAPAGDPRRHQRLPVDESPMLDEHHIAARDGGVDRRVAAPLRV